MEVSVKTVPEELLLSLLELNFPTLDASSWVFHNTLVLGNCNNFIAPETGEWVDIQLNVQKNNTNNLTVNTRRMQVICVPGLMSNVICDTDASNLLRSAVRSGEVPYMNNNIKVTLKEKCAKPLKAVKVDVCLLNSVTSIALDVIDALLIKYFKYQRFFYKGDIFCVEIHKYLPELKFTKGYNNVSTVFFKVCEISSSDGASSSLEGFIVDDTMALYQVSAQNDYLPSVPHLLSKSNNVSITGDINISDFLKPHLPPHLQIQADKLKTYFRPFMIYNLVELQLKPFFVVSGPVGCGKKLLLSSVAKVLGLHYWHIECSSLIAGPSGFNEAKLKSVFTRVAKHLPCLLHLTSLEVLSEDKEGNEDTRIISCFNKLLMELNFDLPLIVVGSTNAVDKLSSTLLQNVLHVINIESPTLDERANAVTWLCTLPHSDALKIAGLTSGFTLSDLTFLVTQTYREKFKLTWDDKENKENELVFEDFTPIIDKMNAQTANAIGAPQVPTVAWSDVGGHNEIKKEIVRSLNTADLGTGLRRSGILLWGPPGTGKTLLAKAVATECRSTFLSVKGPELLNMYVGQSEQNVRQVFERAREAAPCIIFFDELDSLAPNRGQSDSAGVMDRVVSQLLSEMDGLQKNEGVFVLGATNRPDLIDPALLRPGRLDKMLYVGPCEGTEAKLSVLKALTRKFEMSSDIDLSRIAESLPLSLTGADLYSVCYNAWQNAARTVIKSMQSANSDVASTVIVSSEDFNAAVNNLVIES